MVTWSQFSGAENLEESLCLRMQRYLILCRIQNACNPFRVRMDMANVSSVWLACEHATLVTTTKNNAGTGSSGHSLTIRVLRFQRACLLVFFVLVFSVFGPR